MTLPADYHMHTPLCRHAVGEPHELAEHAVAAGLTEIGFSDHNPMRADDFDDWRMKLRELDQYVEKVKRARHLFPQLTIKLALEVDYLPGGEGWVQELGRMYRWDYFIGSVHYLSDGWAIDNPQQLSKWKEREPMQVWTAYFERLGMAAESGLFEIIGHADLCKKFCIYPEGDCTPLFRRFLASARRGGVAIELNTAGLRKECREIYPSLPFLKLAAEMDVPVTFGSDAHAPEEVGLNFQEAVEQARAAGYTRCLRFSERQREMVNL